MIAFTTERNIFVEYKSARALGTIRHEAGQLIFEGEFYLLCTHCYSGSGLSKLLKCNSLLYKDVQCFLVSLYM